MGNVTQINVEGRNYNLVAGQAAKGACTTSAAAYEKVVVLPDSTDIVVGMLVAVTFVNGNTAGFSGKKTIYSSDGTNFYWDSNLTDPVVLPPEGCYIIENASGQEYEYQAFPVLSVNGEVLPLCNSKGHPTGGPLWNAGDVVTFLYLEDRFIAILAEEGTDIKVYPTLAEAEADLNNLSEGDIVGTEQGGDGAVDAVIAGDMRLVTSNAVAVKSNAIVAEMTAELSKVKNYNKLYYELNLESLSTSNFYPVTFPSTDLELECEIHSPNLGGAAAYNQNRIHFLYTYQGWTDAGNTLNILSYNKYEAAEVTIGAIGGGSRNGGNAVWIRGGLKYRFICNQVPTLHTSSYTRDSQTYSVGTSFHGGTNSNVNIKWEATTS